MPKIPDATAFGERPVPVSQRGAPSYQGGIAERAAVSMGEAGAKLGASVAGAVKAIGEPIEQEQDLVALSAANQQFLDAKLKADKAALDDQDYTTLPDRYQATLTGAMKDAAGTLRSPKGREDFLSGAARIVNFGADAVIRDAHRKAVDAGRGNTVEAVNAGINQALQAGDEPTRVAALQAVHDRIDAAEKSGWFHSAEAAKLRKTVPETFAKRFATMRIDLDPSAAFQELAPPGMDEAPGLATKRPGARVEIPESSRLAFVNNNPGNLRFAGQDGATQGEGGFAKFATPEDGAAALDKQVSLDAARGATLGDFITKYAPPSENDTATYTAQAARALGVDASTPLASIPKADVVSFVAQKESGARIVSDGPQATPAVAGGGGAPQARDVVFPKTGDYRDFLNPADRMDLARTARLRADQITAAREVDAQRRARIEAQAEKQRLDTATGNIVSQLIKDPSKVDPVRDIANNPDIPGAHKWSVFQMVTAANKETDKDTKTYGPGFYQAYQDVHNGKITDPTALFPRVGDNGDLTVAGVDKLRGEIEGRRTPEGVAEGEMKKGALAYAKHQLSFEADYGMVKIRDPKGEDAFNVGFIPAFYQAYDAGRKAGKTPYQLLSKDSPDFIIDKLAGPLKRSPQQLMRDQMEASTGAPAGPEATAEAAPDFSSAAGIVAAYRAKKITREDAERMALEKGFIKPAAPAAEVPSVPLR